MPTAGICQSFQPAADSLLAQDCHLPPVLTSTVYSFSVQNTRGFSQNLKSAWELFRMLFPYTNHNLSQD